MISATSRGTRRVFERLFHFFKIVRGRRDDEILVLGLHVLGTCIECQRHELVLVGLGTD